MDDWLQGRITQKHHWTERLYSLRIDAPIKRFTPGRFIRIALDIDGEQVARPYSCVNPPGEPGLEIYYNTVENGPLTTALLEVGEGDTLWVGRNAGGFFTLDEAPSAAMDARHGHRPRRVPVPARNHGSLVHTRNSPTASAAKKFAAHIPITSTTFPW